MKIVKKKVSDLAFAPYNPRQIDDITLDKLTASIERFGYVEPIVVNKRTGHIVGGEQRAKALAKLGIDEVECVEIDIDPESEKALNLALNKIEGTWDYEKLRAVFAELDAELTPLTGFGPEEIAVLTADFDDLDLSDIEDEISELEEKANDKGANYVVYLSFPSKEEAESWLVNNGFEKHAFKPGARTMVIEMG